MAKVLIVDDERSIRTTMAEFVKEEGHDVWTAEDAGEALKRFAEVLPDVVVTDIILPRIDGMTLLRRIHEIRPETQVIVVTGEPTVDTAAEAVREGAFDYLAKPVTGGEIRAIVASAARVKEMADDRRRLEEENLRYRLHLEEEVERAVGELRASETRYRAVVEHAAEAIFIVQDGAFRFVNAASTTISGHPAESLRDHPFVDLLHPEDRVPILDAYERMLKGGEARGLDELRIVRADGEVRWLRARSVRIDWEGRPASLTVARDVTERKAAEESARLRAERTHIADTTLLRLATLPSLAWGDLPDTLAIIAETVADTIEVERVEVWLKLGEGGESTCAELFERSPRRHSRGRKPSLTVHPRYSAALRAERSIVASDARNDPRTNEFNETHFVPFGIGALIDVAVRVGGDVVGTFSVEHVGPPHVWSDEAVAFVRGVTDLVAVAVESWRRRETELALRRSEAEHRAMFEDSPVSLMVEDFSEVKRSFEKLRADGVVDLERHLEQHPELVAKYQRMIRIIDANEAAIRLHGATSKAQMLGQHLGEAPPGALPVLRSRLLSIWRGERVFEATATDEGLDGRAMPVVLRWSVPPGEEATLGRVLLAKTDISSLVKAQEGLRKTLDGVIEAIGQATESRDPYTAGHQRMVTDLAVAIGQELGLAPDVIDGIRAAGLLHDVGKLAIPAEILSKPSALSRMEMELMKGHPQAGYDILKAVEFPWPVPQIVLEHHERLDGTGYPRGLKGDEICLEARVLAVADVVEAMASHRPYRPALGVGPALEEILRGRGSEYDADVVDVCARLLREGRFSFRTELR